MKKVAKLVTVSFITRVIVDEDATEVLIMSEAKPNFYDKLNNNELFENLESIVDDENCPYSEEDELYQDDDPDGINDTHIEKANKILVEDSDVITTREAIRKIIAQAKIDIAEQDDTLIEAFDDDITVVESREFSLYCNEFLDEIDYKL